MRQTRRQITPEQALARLELQCCRAEMAEGEAREKMRRWHIDSRDADNIAETLKSRRFIDDRRFARAFVNDKMKYSGWGRRKIRYALMMKHVNDGIIEESLSDIDTGIYTGTLMQMVRNKINAQPAIVESYEQRTKLYRWILSRGYEPQLASDTLRKILGELGIRN